MIGIGMWLGTIMWFNVWFVIWPNQQKALNIGNKYPDLAAPAKAAAAKTAGHVHAHQHAAFDSDAVLHGGGVASALTLHGDFPKGPSGAIRTVLSF